MKKKRIVITGGPGAGKTSLIDELCTKGYRTHAEYSRSLIQKAQSEGTLNYFLSHPQEFSEALFEGRKHQYHTIISLQILKFTIHPMYFLTVGYTISMPISRPSISIQKLGISE